MYQVVLVHDGEAAWADEVEAELRAACRRVAHSDAGLVRAATVADAAATSDPTVVVCLATPTTAGSAAMAHELTAAKGFALPVLPVVRAGTSVTASLPTGIRRLNALTWDDHDAVSLSVLRALGLAETERRLFLSYRQIETSALAMQLRHALADRSFDVFLDRFSVPPGADFQRRINEELSDKAFVLLLESAGAVGSDWVQHEVTYALSHNIALLAFTTPDTETEQQFEVVDEAFRLRLALGDLVGPTGSTQVLSAGSLARILDEVEARHARGVRRRRLQLLASASDFLHDAGYDRWPLDEWSVLGSKNGDNVVLAATPVAPAPNALRRLDLNRRRAEDDGLGPGSVRIACLVHEAPDVNDAERALVDWIIEGRPLSTSIVTEIPGLLR